MKKQFCLCIFILLAHSCGSVAQYGQRNPAQMTNGSSCFEMASEIVGNYNPYSLADFPNLSYDFIKESDLLSRLVALNQLKENQEQAQIILALIKKKNPKMSPNELAKRYAEIFSECG